ncbi:MAG: hypothetical protein U9Q06_03960 [Nanoarchaeota archaeon]|nr:hypothetical protein [Nanoarchaeota archaeon]
MPADNFLFRKENQLRKSDKSIRQKWDKQILGLCNKLNQSPNYYTTSSCSGRVVLLIDSDEKQKDLFIKVWHDKITFKQLKNQLKNISSDKLIYFKQDPCILHVCTNSLKNAQKIHDLAKESGWKRCGIIASKKRFIVELNATAKLEFPIYNKKIMVDDNFLKFLIKETNKKLEHSWNCIKKLEETLADSLS